MNLVNVDKAVTIMERARDIGSILYMASWQGRVIAKDDGDYLRECGTGACFGGWVAVSPEFRADGGSMAAISGAPRIHFEDTECCGPSAIAIWLGIGHEEASCLCGIGGNDNETAYPDDSEEDGEIAINAITFNDVLEALNRLKETGTCIVPIVLETER